MPYRFDKHKEQRRALAIKTGDMERTCKQNRLLLSYIAELEWELNSANLRIEILKHAKEETCPDGLMPDGTTCPGCGCKRAPSGIGGGSWVHVR
jgi:hypothetical protein